MTIKHKLAEIAGHYSNGRMNDHTMAVIKGFNMNPIPIAIVPDSMIGNTYGSQNYATMDDLVSLRGVQRPLVLDPRAMRGLCIESLEAIIQLETENALLRHKLTAIGQILSV